MWKSNTYLLLPTQIESKTVHTFSQKASKGPFFPASLTLLFKNQFFSIVRPEMQFFFQIWRARDQKSLATPGLDQRFSTQTTPRPVF
jgi:hypothetical protein